MKIRNIIHSPFTGQRIVDTITPAIPSWVPFRDDALMDLEAQGWYEGRTRDDHRFLLINLDSIK